MSIAKQKFREVLFQALYSHEVNPKQSESTLELIAELAKISPADAKEASSMVDLVRDHHCEIDQYIYKATALVEVDRLSHIDLVILRLGVYELALAKAVPPKVAISEAIRLARKFSNPESAKLINVILDALLNKCLSNNQCVTSAP